MGPRSVITNHEVESLKGVFHYLLCLPWSYGSTTVRHCADAVLSFANKATVVSRMMTRLMEFICQWAQTPSDYDVLIAHAFSAEWAQDHLPVLSRKGEHVMYTGWNPIEPEGLPLFCHNRGCGVENRVWERRKTKVHLTCLACGSTCSLDAPHALDMTTPLGRREMLKVGFPPKPALGEWKVLNSPIRPTPSEQSLPAVPDSTSYSQLSPLVPPPAPSPAPSLSQPHPLAIGRLRIPPLASRTTSRTSSTSSGSGHSPHHPRDTPSTVYVMRNDPDLTRGRNVGRGITLADYPAVHISTESRQPSSNSSRKRPRDPSESR